MSGRFLLDTNITIAFLSGERVVVNQVDNAEACFVSSIIAGEMFYGAACSANVDENIRRIDSFLADTELVSCDERTSRIFGEIKASLRRKGRPIPENDIWIAASARQHSLTLVTRDRHFEEIDGLARVDW